MYMIPCTNSNTNQAYYISHVCFLSQLNVNDYKRFDYCYFMVFKPEDREKLRILYDIFVAKILHYPEMIKMFSR